VGARIRLPRGIRTGGAAGAAGGAGAAHGAGDGGQVARPRDAATVMLLREGPEVFMLRRVPRMAFAPGAQVFPGGSVDPLDLAPDVPWQGPSAEWFGTTLGVAADRARAIVVAAVRETFEESGVLLASPGLGTGTSALREALAAHELSLADLLVRHGLVLRADWLTPWARWVTPEAEPRRYDTFFFAAAVPGGQVPADLDGLDGPAGLAGLAGLAGGEADAAGWITPHAALAAARAGDALVLPPTAVNLAELGSTGDVPTILSQRRVIRPVCPSVVEDDGGVWLVIPDEVEYPL
jgi:8-oxo-dGTP pyrophosphatase MutT (NUDIX family)